MYNTKKVTSDNIQQRQQLHIVLQYVRQTKTVSHNAIKDVNFCYRLIIIIIIIIIINWRNNSTRATAASISRFLDHKRLNTHACGKTPLDG